MTAVMQARLPILLHFAVSYEAPDQFPHIVHMLLIVPFGSPCNFPAVTPLERGTQSRFYGGRRTGCGGGACGQGV